MDSRGRITGQARTMTRPARVEMTDFTAKSIADILLTSAEVKRLAAEQCAGAAMQAAEMIAASLREGGKLMLCGNGGSAADSQHLAAEFVATLDHRRPRGGLSALALTLSLIHI